MKLNKYGTKCNKNVTLGNSYVTLITYYKQFIKHVFFLIYTQHI